MKISQHKDIRLGIVGPEASKFIPSTELAAKDAIGELYFEYNPSIIVSGGCPKGGIDIWAEELAKEYQILTRIYLPDKHTWSGKGGYRERNLMIANGSDVVVVVTPKKIRGKDAAYCYHCKGRKPPHVMSGGCWTAWRAKLARWVIISDN